MSRVAVFICEKTRISVNDISVVKNLVWILTQLNIEYISHIKCELDFYWQKYRSLVYVNLDSVELNAKLSYNSAAIEKFENFSEFIMKQMQIKIIRDILV